MSKLRSVLKARYVFTVAGPPIRDGAVTIENGRIVAVGPSSRLDYEGRERVYGAILPGLVNAHTHLEFSDLEAPLGAPSGSLSAWIRHVVAVRRSASEREVDARGQGLAEAGRGGATSIGEIATKRWPPPLDGLVELLAKADVTAFWEVIGLDPALFDERLAAARAHLADPWSVERNDRPGLSPHAPYSVHPELFEQVLKLALQADVPVAMHLAESREELELLACGTGRFRKMLEDLGVWQPGVFIGGRRPLDYLKALAGARQALVIHGNYLDREEIDFLAAHRGNMSLVYCPRTHAHFGHDPYPLAEMLDRGVNVALGTDSRASNPDLSMLSEMWYAAQSHPQVAQGKILEMATIAGARALGTDAGVGTLEPGKLANLVIVDLPKRDVDDPHRLLFEGKLSARQLWRGEPFLATLDGE